MRLITVENGNIWMKKNFWMKVHSLLFVVPQIGVRFSHCDPPPSIHSFWHHYFVEKNSVSQSKTKQHFDMCAQSLLNFDPDFEKQIFKQFCNSTKNCLSDTLTFAVYFLSLSLKYCWNKNNILRFFSSYLHLGHRCEGKLFFASWDTLRLMLKMDHLQIHFVCCHPEELDIW